MARGGKADNPFLSLVFWGIGWMDSGRSSASTTSVGAEPLHVLDSLVSRWQSASRKRDSAALAALPLLFFLLTTLLLVCSAERDAADRASRATSDASKVADGSVPAHAPLAVLGSGGGGSPQSRLLLRVLASYRVPSPFSAVLAEEIISLGRASSTDPIFLASLISVESSFNTSARSSAGAIGLMQLMPKTALAFSKNIPARFSDKDDPKLWSVRRNLEIGIAYLKHLERRFENDPVLVLAAYNWGPTNVDRVERDPRRFPSSVRRYITKVLSRASQWERQLKTEGV